MASMSLLAMTLRHHSHAMWCVAVVVRTLTPISATVRFSRLSGRIPWERSFLRSGMPCCFSGHSDAQWFLEPQLKQPPRVQEWPWRDLSCGREDLQLSSRRLLSWERRLADSFHFRGYDFLLPGFRERTEKREESEDDLRPRKDERDELRSLVSRLSSRVRGVYHAFPLGGAHMCHLKDTCYGNHAPDLAARSGTHSEEGAQTASHASLHWEVEHLGHSHNGLYQWAS